MNEIAPMTMVTRLSCCGLALMTGAAIPLLAIEARAQSVGAALLPGSQAGAKASVGTGSTTQPTPSTPTDAAAAAIPTEQVIVRARLDRLRSQIEPDLGATVYQLTRGAIETIPQGDNAPLNQVLLQAPGVAQDSFGQIHVRGDHNEIQFRLDGVQLPEGLTVFGQALETRFAQSLSLITGALPAEYGFDTAAVINIQTKTGVTDPGRRNLDLRRRTGLLPAERLLRDERRVVRPVRDGRLRPRPRRHREPDRNVQRGARSHQPDPRDRASRRRA